MTQREANGIAHFLWNQLNLDPEETIGHNHYTREEFANEIHNMIEGN